MSGHMTYFGSKIEISIFSEKGGGLRLFRGVATQKVFRIRNQGPQWPLFGMFHANRYLTSPPSSSTRPEDPAARRCVGILRILSTSTINHHTVNKVNWLMINISQLHYYNSTYFAPGIHFIASTGVKIFQLSWILITK